MKIGEAARHVGVPVHVLRHWNDVGVVVPSRTPSGHREYDSEHLHRLRVLRACQEAGMSLSDIKMVLHRREDGRAHMLAEHLQRIRAHRAQLDATERFLIHVIGCEHDVLTRCSACSAYPSNVRPSAGTTDASVARTSTPQDQTSR